MVYFNQSEIKFDLNITGTTFDTAITSNWGPKADEDVDNRVYEAAEKARRITELPVLPFTTTPTSIQSASNHFVKMRYYQRTRNSVKEKEEETAANNDIAAYVRRLKVDQEWYMRLAR